MPKKLAKREDAKNFAPRFDSARAPDSATLRDLIAELNAQYYKESFEEFSENDLRGTLAFLEGSIGFKVESNTQTLPVSTLKTIKLLYLTGANSGRHMFGMLARPVANNATMEFSTGTTISRDKHASALIRSLTLPLSREIDPVKLTYLNLMLGDKELHTTAEKLLLHAVRTNDKVIRILTSRLAGNEEALANAYRSLSKAIDIIHVRRTPAAPIPVNEAVFMYLETLAFQHFALHFPKHLQNTRVKGKIGDIRDDAARYCQTASEQGGMHLSPFDKVFSINNFHHLVFGWPDEFTSLVKAATGHGTPRKQLKQNTVRAKALLVPYVYRAHEEFDPDARTLAVYDIVAALCSVRYQQVEDTEYKPYWHGQKDQGTCPQRFLDKGLSKNDPHQHQGVLQIYLNRFYDFQASFNTTTESHQAWMQYQVSHLEAYRRLVQLNDIVAVVTGITSMNSLCVSRARDIIIEHLNANQ